MLTDFKQDYKDICEAESTNMAGVGRRLGVTTARIAKYLEKAGITKKYEELCEVLGYDIKLTYVKKGEAVPDPKIPKSPKTSYKTKAWLEKRYHTMQEQLAETESDLQTLESLLAGCEIPAEAKEILKKYVFYAEDEWDDEEWM